MAQKANMPANNRNDGPKALGVTHNSNFAKPKALGGSRHGGKQNLPTKNSPNTTPPLGTTKHAPGTVPGYLKRGK